MISLPPFLAHFIGDFLIQTDWMAKGKKSNNIICLVHVICYMIPFLLCEITIYQFALIAVQHWGQDRTTIVQWYCKKFTIFQSELNLKSLPWGHIIVDQVFHLTWIWVVLNYI